MRSSFWGTEVLPDLSGRTILQILPKLEAGGAERTALHIAAAIVEAGGRALVACEGGRMVSELQLLGGLWVPFPAATKSPLKMWRNVRRLARIVRDEGVDILHARSRAPAWVALGAARRTRRPLVTTYHGSYSGASALKRYYNSVMARGDAVIANSRFTAEAILALYPFARERLTIIHRGTDLRVFSPAKVEPERIARLREAWGVSPYDRIVLLAARLTGWKGQRVLIEAAAGLRAENVRIILAGDSQGRDRYVRELDRLIVANGVGDIVTRVGHCVDMPAAFLTAAVVAVPSTEPEAFGRSAVEAQAMGTPVVVSDLGAASETVLVGAERTGWRVPAGDAAALGEALREALNLGASARDAMARRARLHVEKNFSLTHMSEQTLGVYAGLLRGV